MRLFSILLLACSLFAISCGDDEVPLNIIHFDGDNSNSPLFDPGFNEASVEFSSAVMSDFVDREIKSVRFYLFDVPEGCEVAIYEGTGDRPGNEIYSFDFTDIATPNGWNVHVLTSPLALDGSEIWVSIKMNNTDRIQAIGCDAGPAEAGGDWLYRSSSAMWETFRNITTNVSVNWNIRLDLVEL